VNTESAPPATALAVDSALAAIAVTSLWPNFAPLHMPVAIFDGMRTWLFRHPQAPAQYVAVRGRADAAVRDGRDPAVTANSSATLGGVSTATVMLDPRSTAGDVAALTVHELFHVFQRARHSTWQANEADLFTYPVERVDALALRRLETLALRRAIDATVVDSMRCWSRAFLDARRAREMLIGPQAATYERATELNEGLARYVELRARQRRVQLPAADYPADQPRLRAYEVGAAVGQLLDRLRPDWRETLEAARADSLASLEEMLAPALAGAATGTCTEPDSLARAVAARDEVRALRENRAQRRTEFLTQPGWSVVVDAGSSPLFPQGFDPLNVSRLSETEVLHGRFLTLGNGAGTIELLSRASLTEGRPKQHPLFGGVARLTVTGLAAAPTVRDSAGVLLLAAPGVRAALTGARVDTAGQAIRVQMR
jgi:hypothetical protein